MNYWKNETKKIINDQWKFWHERCVGQQIKTQSLALLMYFQNKIHIWLNNDNGFLRSKEYVPFIFAFEILIVYAMCIIYQDKQVISRI